MAFLKQRLHRKNSSGSYDVVYLETSSDLVKMSDGTTLTSKISSMDTSINGKQNASTAINTSNISSQSVNYANSASNADTVDGYHASALIAAASASGARIQTGSYVGTGAYGANSPCTLTFNFTPKILIIFYDDAQYDNGNDSLHNYVILIHNRSKIIRMGTFSWGDSSYMEYYSQLYSLYFSFNSNSVSYYTPEKSELVSSRNSCAKNQLNDTTITYSYCALG